jgi:hypothetical protein
VQQGSCIIDGGVLHPLANGTSAIRHKAIDLFIFTPILCFVDLSVALVVELKITISENFQRDSYR